MSLDYRSTDAVLTICQNNKTQSITITGLNESAIDITGYRPEELTGKPLKNILPQRINELLMDYVEFDVNANDVGAVLGKVRSFSIVDRNGTETIYRAKLVRQSSSETLLNFSLVLQNTLGARKNEAIKKTIQDNFKGHESLHAHYDIPDRLTLIKDIGVMKRYVNNDILSCFAVLQIDNYAGLIAKHGNDKFLEIFKHLAFITKRSMRPDDVVGFVGEGRIGALLVDLAAGSERLVLNRIRWQIASNPYVDANKNTIGISVSISYSNISAVVNERQLIEHCEAALDSASSKAQNMLIDIAA